MPNENETVYKYIIGFIGSAKGEQGQGRTLNGSTLLDAARELLESYPDEETVTLFFSNQEDFWLCGYKTFRRVDPPKFEIEEVIS